MRTEMKQPLKDLLLRAAKHILMILVVIAFGFLATRFCSPAPAEAQSQSSFERDLVQAEQRQARALEDIAREMRRLSK